MKANYRLHFLDGIRGWAALAVVLNHLFCAIPVAEKTVKYLPFIPFFNGKLAVALFFVVSGFSLSIGYCLTKDRQLLTRISLGRYFRLTIPIFAISLLTLFAFWLGLMPKMSYRPSAFQSLLTITPSFWDTIASSIYGVYLDDTKSQILMPQLWTMAYECWGSCLVIATLAIFANLNKKIFIYLILLIAAYFIKPYPWYVSFVLGLIFAEIYSDQIFSEYKKYMSIAAKILLVPALFFCIMMTKMNLYFYLLGPSLLSFCLIFNPGITTFLSNPFSRFLGKISYSLYLVHVLILYVFTMNLLHIFHLTNTNSFSWLKLLINILTLIICIVIARALTPIDQFAIQVGKNIAHFFLKPATSTQPDLLSSPTKPIITNI